MIRRLALFDLDHTLIPYDSGMAWLRFLVRRGVLSEAAPERYLDCCRRYLAGALSLAELHRVAMAPLAQHGDPELDAWREEFAVGAAAAIPDAAYRLVARHRHAGALCCIVTTTNDFIAAPFAEALDVTLLASVAERRRGRFTGEVVGELCHGEAKLRRVGAWLEGLGLTWADFGHTMFYSDSASDLPLLGRVSEAVAVRPDAELRRVALHAAWRIAETLDDAFDRPVETVG